MQIFMRAITCLCRRLIVNSSSFVVLFNLAFISTRCKWGTMEVGTRMCPLWLWMLAWLSIWESFVADHGCTHYIEASVGQTRTIPDHLMIYPAHCILKLIGVYRCALVRILVSALGRCPVMKPKNFTKLYYRSRSGVKKVGNNCCGEGTLVWSSLFF